MSARGTTLYAALDNMADAFAIETSGDEGMTWRPLMRFDKDVDGGATGYIQAIQTCVMSYCQTDCDNRARARSSLSQDVCSAAVMPNPRRRRRARRHRRRHGQGRNGGTDGGRTPLTGGHPTRRAVRHRAAGAATAPSRPGRPPRRWSLVALLAGVAFLCRGARAMTGVPRQLGRIRRCGHTFSGPGTEDGPKWATNWKIGRDWM